MATEVMHLDTDEARGFVNTIQNPAQTGPPPAQACAGGVPNCAMFQKWLDMFVKDAYTFLSLMDRGINGYRDVVTACYLDYEDTDLSNAERITANMKMNPGDLSERLRSTGGGWTEEEPR
jgi:hypothetical protein